MNPTPIDPLQLDLLVDGELEEPERRDLLLQADREPGGWRQCAMAFLEAQTWRREFPVAPESSPPAIAATRGPSGRISFPGKTLLAMAASFLLALGIGLQFAGEGTVTPNQSNQLAESPRTGPTPDAPMLGVDDPATPWQVVSVPVTSSQGASSIGVPCTERQSVDEAWLDTLPEAMPQEVVDAFQQAGHEVTRQRRPVSMPLEDGRQLVIPVDQVQIRYVGNRGYQ